MWWRRSILLGLLLSAGCTKPNPRSCADGTCTDPAFPFCDVGGELSGVEKQCIAVACTPGEVDLCRGDKAVTCNAEGTDYDIVQCDLGCDENLGGCRLCEPNQTACTNGTVATCDANGTVTASESCALGCFEDEPRCREIASSNSLDMYLDAARTASDLDLSMGGQVFPLNGEVRNAIGTALPVSSVLLPASAGGAPIRVLIAKRVRLGNVQVGAYTTSAQPALAIVASDEISVEGKVTLWQNDRDGGTTNAGGVQFAGCAGVAGTYELKSSPTQELWYGGGGGGHATAGGAGGGIQFQTAGGAAGVASGSETLVPLRGGCNGGGGGAGGGAIQLTSRRAISILENAQINASGELGVAVFQGPTPLGGGGAGGGILLEAPVVTIGINARLLANGGPAATESNVQPATSLTRAASPGATCSSTTSYFCANGGDGAGADGPATIGGAVTYTNSPSVTTFRAAGGGGGLGFIRINTRTGEYETASDSIVSGATTKSVLGTR